MAVVEYAQGTQAFLTMRLSAILPALNTDLATKVTGAVKPAFVLNIGDIPSTSEHRICTSFVSNQPTPAAFEEELQAVTFKILCLIPTAGDNISSSFEMAKQVSHDHINTLFADDDLMLTPKIDTGLFGEDRAIKTRRQTFIDIFPRMMMDGQTVVRGWQFLWTAYYSLRTR